jgi:phosphate transport system substrate-binding protein
MKRTSVIAMGVLLSGFSLILIPRAQTEIDKSHIRVTCPYRMLVRINALSKVFMKAHPEVTIEFAKGYFAEQGIPALLKGSADVVMSTRGMSDQEVQAAVGQGKELVERVIGYGGIVILVNRSNPLNSITVDNLRKILKGDCARWNQVGGNDERITVISVGSKHPGTLIFLQNDFLGGASITNEAVMTEDFPTVIRKISRITGAIGFVRFRDALERHSTRELETKIVGLKQNDATAAVIPSRAAIVNGSYPLRRPYFSYHESQASPAIVEYVDFLAEIGWGPQDL